MPADAPGLNPPGLALVLLEMLGLLVGEDDAAVGDEMAAGRVEEDEDEDEEEEDDEEEEAEDVVVEVVEAAVIGVVTTAWPKFHPLTWIPATNPPFEPTVVEVVNQGPVKVVMVRYFSTCPGVKVDWHCPRAPRST
jgi:hypothetical protein